MDDDNKGRSSPIASMFSGVGNFFTKAVSPTIIRKDGDKDPVKLKKAPGFGSDVQRPSAVLATNNNDALKKAPSSVETEKQGGEPEKKGWLWGGRRRRKSRRRKTKRRKKKRKSRRRKKTRRKKKRKSRRRKSRRRKR